MTYIFLELFNVSNKARFKFETLGDFIGPFRNKNSVNIFNISHICGENAVDIDTMFDKLELSRKIFLFTA